MGAVLTFLAGDARVGLDLAGLAACLLHVWLGPRFYNYPKILVYAAAIPLLWWFADRPGPGCGCRIAVLTVIAFLFRHDHGAFVGLATVVLMLSLTELRIAERVRHVVIYGLLVAVLVAPYFIFIQINGGVVSYFRQASAWAERDRARETDRLAGLCSTIPMACRMQRKPGSLVASVRDNGAAWMYYTRDPAAVLRAVRAGRRRATGSGPNGRTRAQKLAMVAVLGAGARCRVSAQPARGAAGRSVGAAGHPHRVADGGGAAHAAQRRVAATVVAAAYVAAARRARRGDRCCDCAVLHRAREAGISTGGSTRHR